MTNNRKVMWYTVLVSTTEEENEMLFVVNANRDSNAKANAVKPYRKKFSEEISPELFVTIVYKSTSARDNDIFYRGFLAGRKE